MPHFAMRLQSCRPPLEAVVWSQWVTSIRLVSAAWRLLVFEQLSCGLRSLQDVIGSGKGTVGMRVRLNQAGGLVYRHSRASNRLEILMITAKNSTTEWLLPKGDIDEGETPEYTARKEVYEEAGVIARVERRLGSIRYAEGRWVIDLTLFLMQYVGNSRESHERRLKRWVSPANVHRVHHLGRRIRPVVGAAMRALRNRMQAS